MVVSKPSWVKAVWMLNMAGTSVSINVKSSSVNTCSLNDILSKYEVKK